MEAGETKQLVLWGLEAIIAYSKIKKFDGRADAGEGGGNQAGAGIGEDGNEAI